MENLRTPPTELVKAAPPLARYVLAVRRLAQGAPIINTFYRKPALPIAESENMAIPQIGPVKPVRGRVTPVVQAPAQPV